VRGLRRVLGGAFGLAVGVGAMIGGGILRTPGDVAAQLPRTIPFVTIWIVGAVSALLGATAYGELGAMIPRCGGPYAYARRAMGDRIGFVVVIMDCINYAISIAALVLLIGEYMGAFVPAAASHPTLAGFVVFGGIILLQWQGILWTGRVQEITSVLKTVALLGLVGAAIVLPHGTIPASTAAAAPVYPHGVALLAALALSMQGVIFTYDSYYQVIYCGEELVDPCREIPRSMFRSTWLVIVVFMLVIGSFVTMVPVERMAGDPFVGATVARAVFGERGDIIIRVIMIVSLIGAVNALALSAPRILYAMSEDRLFPKQAAQVNEAGTPSGATIMTVVLIAAFLFSGSFSAAIAIDSIIIVGGYIVVFTSLFVLRRREPDTPRPYRAWAYPFAPGLALIFALSVEASLIWADPRSSIIGIALVLSIWPVSRLVRRLATART